MSREEISAMANIGTEEGIFEEKENKIIQNLVRLRKCKGFRNNDPKSSCYGSR